MIVDVERNQNNVSMYISISVIMCDLDFPLPEDINYLANDICRPYYCCHEYVSFLDTT